MSVNTCLIYRCLSSASAFICSWFIYELQNSTTMAFSRTHSTLSTPENPPVEFPHAFRFQIVNTPPCPQNSIIVNPPSPLEILKAIRGIVWIFSGIAQCYLKWQREEVWRHVAHIANFLDINNLSWQRRPFALLNDGRKVRAYSLFLKAIMHRKVTDVNFFVFFCHICRTMLCCNPEILLPWTCDVMTSPLYTVGTNY